MEFEAAMQYGAYVTKLYTSLQQQVQIQLNKIATMQDYIAELEERVQILSESSSSGPGSPVSVIPMQQSLTVYVPKNVPLQLLASAYGGFPICVSCHSIDDMMYGVAVYTNATFTLFTESPVNGMDVAQYIRAHHCSGMQDIICHGEFQGFTLKDISYGIKRACLMFQWSDKFRKPVMSKHLVAFVELRLGVIVYKSMFKCLRILAKTWNVVQKRLPDSKGG